MLGVEAADNILFGSKVGASCHLSMCGCGCRRWARLTRKQWPSRVRRFGYTVMCACLLSWCHMLSSLDHCFFIILAWQ